MGIAICNLASLQQRIGKLTVAKQTLDRLSPELAFDGRRFRNAARISAACTDPEGKLAAGCGEQALDLLQLAASRYLAEVTTSPESLNDAPAAERSKLINLVADRLSVVSELQTGPGFASIRVDSELMQRFSDLTSEFNRSLLDLHERLAAGGSPLE